MPFRDPTLLIRCLARHKDLMLQFDLRVGQFIDNALTVARGNSPAALFYIEDADLVQVLDSYAASMKTR